MKKKSLAEARPDLLVQWSPDNELLPADVSYGSNKRVLWICNKGHTWSATVKNRVVSGSSCPYCSHRAVLKGFNDLQTLFPKIAETWSPNNTLSPADVSSRSNAEVLWICHNGHEWQARIADRTDGHGCPYCAGQRVWKGFNDLTTTHPDLISEWSYKNTTLSPDTITCKSRINVWWHCSKCGNEYQAVVYSKVNGRNCPFCVASELKILQNIKLAQKKVNKDFIYLLPQLATIYYAGKRGLKVYIDSETVIGIPVTAYIPSIKLVIDVCLSNKERTIKNYICNANSIKYVCLSENLLEIESISQVRTAFSDAHIYFNTQIQDDLEIIRKNYISYKRNGSDSSSKP